MLSYHPIEKTYNTGDLNASKMLGFPVDRVYELYETNIHYFSVTSSI